MSGVDTSPAQTGASRISILFAIPALDKAGPDRVFFELLRAIDRRHFAPALVVSEPEGYYLSRLPTDIPIHRLGCETGLFSRYPVLHLARLVRRLKPDVVLATLRMVLTAGLARPLFPQRTRLVLRPANHVSSNSRELITRAPVKHRLSAELHRFALARADHIICQGEDLEHDLRSLGVRLPMTVIGNPVDVDDIMHLAADDVALPGIPSLLAVGRLSQQKGFDLLLPAFARVCQTVPDAHLTILGTGREEGALRRLAGDLSVTEHVTFAGFIENPYPQMRAANLFVLSSRYEGFPNVILEALACGTPVVATTCSGVVGLVKPGVNGWLAPAGDVEALARALSTAIAEHTNLKSEVIKATVRRAFGTENIVQRYERALATRVEIVSKP